MVYRKRLRLVIVSLIVAGVACKESQTENARVDAAADATLVDGAEKQADGQLCTADPRFSFFVVSLERIKAWGGPNGLGGNLGGLAGADAKCQEAAEAVGSCRTWRAFLSATDDGTGKPVNAIDRIGDGPWYNVNGLLVAEDKARLLEQRPAAATDVVFNDGWKDWPFNECLTTELGNCNLSYGDSHDTLTGSNRQGELFSTDKRYTCNDWTSTDVKVQLPVGHSWNRHIGSTKEDDADWIYAHVNCSGAAKPDPGGTTCNGCGAMINLTNATEDGVGGYGGYGAWYCFAID
jgi:hypothetical protein